MSARNRDRGLASTNNFKGAQRPQPQIKRTEPQQIADGDKLFKNIGYTMFVLFGGGFIVSKFNLNISSDGVLMLAVMLASVFIYFLPYVVAKYRGHHNTQSILALNLFLGWSFLGWVGALVWSLTKVED